MRVKQINYKILLNVSRSSEVAEFWVIDRKKLKYGCQNSLGTLFVFYSFARGCTL